MNLIELEKKLIEVARANPPSEQVPLAFEKRVMALILSRPVHDIWAAWAKGLWYAAAPCVAIMLLFSGWALFQPAPKTPSVDLAQQFDNTMLAAVDQDQDNDSTW
jgi:hypothetical protein